MGTQNEDRAMSLYVCVIFNPQEFSFLCPMEWNLQMRSQCKPMTNVILVYLIKVIYAKALMIGHSTNCTFWKFRSMRHSTTYFSGTELAE